MSRRFNYVKSEMMKLLELKPILLTSFLLVFLQPLMAFMESKSILQMGNNLKASLNPKLVEDIPPFEYQGLSSLFFGYMVLIVFSAYLGANEFRFNKMRTALLSIPNKMGLFLIRLKAFTILIAMLSFVSVLLTIFFAQSALGSKGYSLIGNMIVLANVFKGRLSYILLAQFTYLIAFLFRNNIIALILMVPQVYNLGGIIAAKYKFGKYLPFNVISSLISTPTSKVLFSVDQSLLLAIVMIIVLSIITGNTFRNSDMGRVK